MVAIPSYGGIEASFVESLLELQAAFLRLGIAHVFVFLPGESLITRARNRLVRRFLDDYKTCSHLLFLDADLVFHPTTILRLLTSGHEVCAAPYAKKAIGAGLVGNVAIIDEQTVNGQRMGRLEERRNGFVKASDAGTGCMLIARAAFQKMIAAKRSDGTPAMVPYTCDLEAGNPKTYAFFDCGPEDSRDPNARYLSEDYFFCRLWQVLCDGSVWLDEAAMIRHIGRHSYAAPSFAQQWREAAK
jgi:hypothetical protein